MNLTDVLKRECIIENLVSRDKESVLHELVSVLLGSHPDLDQQQIVAVLSDREKLGSTGIGNGVAIPHGKTKKLDELLVSFGRAKEGIEFDSLDGKPAHLFFALIAPETSSSMHWKVLAKISKMMKNEECRTSLLGAQTRDDMYRTLSEFGRQI